MASRTGTGRIVIAAVVLAVAGAVFGLVVLVSRPTPSAMSGMDMSQTSPSPTGSGEMPGMDMPGMDHGSGAEPESGHGSGEMPGMEHEAGNAEPAQDRPLMPVLGAFGGGTSAVLLTAGLLRRRDRAASLARQVTGASSRSRK